jgi:hypothetical protein
VAHQKIGPVRGWPPRPPLCRVRGVSRAWDAPLRPIP